eukprot:g3522.t1
MKCLVLKIQYLVTSFTERLYLHNRFPRQLFWIYETICRLLSRVSQSRAKREGKGGGRAERAGGDLEDSEQGEREMGTGRRKNVRATSKEI